MLATLAVPFDTDAVTFAVDSAVELGQRLIVANFVERAPLPLSAMLGYDDLPYPPQLDESLKAPVKLALSLGVEVTRLRVKSFHPIPAMLEVIAEQAPGNPGPVAHWDAAVDSRMIRQSTGGLAARRG